MADQDKMHCLDRANYRPMPAITGSIATDETHRPTMIAATGFKCPDCGEPHVSIASWSGHLTTDTIVSAEIALDFAAAILVAVTDSGFKPEKVDG